MHEINKMTQREIADRLESIVLAKELARVQYHEAKKLAIELGADKQEMAAILNAIALNYNTLAIESTPVC